MTHRSHTARLLKLFTLSGLIACLGLGEAVAEPGAGTPAAPTPAESSQSQTRFDVWEFRVLGNRTLPALSVERAVYPFLGAGKTIADVESARQGLERAYHDAGYGTVFVDTPEQQVEAGVVRLQVTEGRIGRVRVSGARYFSNGQIRAALPALVAGNVPQLSEVQAQLTALNRVTPDRGVVPVLKAGHERGTVDVDLKVDDRLPLHGGLELNDRYTPDTTRLRLNAFLSFDNLFQKQHSLSLQYQSAPESTREARAIVGTYVYRPARWRNTTFAVYALDSDSDVAALGTLSVIGNGQVFGLRAIQTLPERPSLLHNLALGVDYKDFLENINLPGDVAVATPIHYLNWSATYSATLTGERASNGFSLGANLGMRGIGNQAGEFENKRFKGSPNYFYVRGSAQRLQWLGGGLQAFARLAGQFTQNPLVSNEQLAIGGADTVRGYLEASVFGDYGFYGTLELRGAWLSGALHLPSGAAYVLAFYDAGIASILDPLPSQASRFDLASWGLGLRVGGWHGLDLAFDWAHCFTDAGSVQPGDERTLFSVRYSF